MRFIRQGDNLTNSLVGVERKETGGTLGTQEEACCHKRVSLIGVRLIALARGGLGLLLIRPLLPFFPFLPPLWLAHRHRPLTTFAALSTSHIITT